MSGRCDGTADWGKSTKTRAALTRVNAGQVYMNTGGENTGKPENTTSNKGNPNDRESLKKSNSKQKKSEGI